MDILRKFICFFVYAIPLLCLIDACPANTNSGSWEYYGNKCYYFPHLTNFQPDTKNAADLICNEMSSDLLVIEDSDELSYIRGKNISMNIWLGCWFNSPTGDYPNVCHGKLLPELATSAGLDGYCLVLAINGQPQSIKSCANTRAYYVCTVLQECNKALGMEDGRILDSQIMASNSYTTFVAHRARLNNNNNGWSTHQVDQPQYIQITFNEATYVTGIISQGFLDHWVRTYIVRYSSVSEENPTWNQFSTSGGSEKIFNANTDANTAVTNYFGEQKLVQSLRILPQYWLTVIHMRLELLGCTRKTAECSGTHDIGPTVKGRKWSGSIKNFVVITSIEFPCDGVITHWRYWPGRSAKFRAMVFRNISENDSSQYEITGINDITAPQTIEKQITYQVPTTKLISVKAGDVMGFGYGSSRPVPKHTHIGDIGSYDNVNVFIIRSVDPLKITKGQTINTTVEQINSRADSVKASITAWLQNGGKDYYVHHTRLTYDQGVDVCKHIGGQLLLIESQAEQAFIEGIVQSQPKVSGVCRCVYLRCTDSATEGHWMCDNSDHVYTVESGSTPVSSSGYWNWHTNEPGGGVAENNLVLIEYSQGQFVYADTAGNIKRSIICTRTMSPTTAEMTTSIISTASPSITSASAGCISGYLSFQKSCYKLYTDTKSKDDAAEECAKEGTHLVDITTQEEQNFVATMLSDAESSDVWIGLIASADYAPLFWSDGSPLVFTAWEPVGRNQGQTCVRMKSSANYLWGDKPCYEKTRYVCEYEANCHDPLGMEDGSIPNDKITASSEWHPSYGPSRARLNKDEGWIAADNDQYQWIQVTFSVKTVVTAVITQGRGRENRPQWVTQYNIDFTQDGRTWEYVNDGGTPKNFTGNSDQNTPVTHKLPQPISVMALRIRPLAWILYISMRFELLGCVAEMTTTPPTTSISSATSVEMTTLITSIALPSTTSASANCSYPLGIEDGSIPDDQITASSLLDSNHGLSYIRLNQYGFYGWVANVNDQNPWVQVTFSMKTVVSAVITQGRVHFNQWVERYNIEFTQNGSTWEYVNDGKTPKNFTGNSDQNTTVTQQLSQPISLMAIRIRPVAWHSYCSLRFELLGCIAEMTTSPTSTSSTTECSASTVDIGWDIVKYDVIPSPKAIIMIEEIPIPCDGFITKWNFYATTQAGFRALVFREIPDQRKWKIVGINDIPASSITPDTATSYTVPYYNVIKVQANDCVGFVHDANSGFSEQPTSHSSLICKWHEYDDTTVFDLPDVGHTVRFSVYGYRHIAFSAEFAVDISATTTPVATTTSPVADTTTTTPAPTTPTPVVSTATSEPSTTTPVATTSMTTQTSARDCETIVGWPIQDRTLLDSDHHITLVSPDKHFTCDGEITEWRFHATTSNPLRAIVFGPIDGSSTQFKIVGFNDIPAAEINTPVLYMIPRNERITVRAGDVIGWSSEHPLLSFDYGANTRILYKYNLDVIADQVVDVAKDGFNRAYSIQATLKPFGVCNENECLHGGLCIPDVDGPAWCFCPVNWGGERCDQDITPYTQPFAVQPDHNTLSASSFTDAHDALESHPDNGAGWIPLLTDGEPWISMEFMRLAHVMGFVIKGKFSTFKVAYDLAGKGAANKWVIPGADPTLEVKDRLFIAVFTDPCVTTYMKVNMMPQQHVNITMEVLGYYSPSPIEMLCFTNCYDLVTPSRPLSVRASYNKTSAFAQIFADKYFDWNLEIEDEKLTGVFHQVKDFLNMTVTGTHKDVVAIKERTLEPGRSYRLHVDILVVGENYKESQHYNFTTNLPPSLGQCYVTPETGYAAQDSFILSCPGISGDHYGLKYQITTRYPGQGIGAEKAIEDPDSIQKDVKLNLPVGSVKDNFSMEVVVRAIDDIGGYDESVVIVQVKPPEIDANSSATAILLASDSDFVVDKLQTINTLLSYINILSVLDESQTNGDKGVETVNGTNTTSDDSEDLELAERIEFRTAIVNVINSYAQEVNTTEGAKLLITSLQYATDVPEELTYNTQLTLIPSLEKAVNLLYEEGVDGSAFLNRDYSLGIISTLHIVEVNFVDEDQKVLCKDSDSHAKDADTNSDGDQINATTVPLGEIDSGTKANEILESLESKVISKVLQTIYPGEPAKHHDTKLAEMTFYTVAESDRERNGTASGSNPAENSSSTFVIPAEFLGASHVDGSIGISTVSNNRNPYPGSCGMSPSKKIELRDEFGKIIKIKDAAVDVSIAFERDTVENATEANFNLPTTVDMILDAIPLDQQGAYGVQVLIETDYQEGFCFAVYSRKKHNPSVKHYNQFVIFPMDGERHDIVFDDLEHGDVRNSPIHHLGFKLVVCNKTVVTDGQDKKSAETNILKDNNILDTRGEDKGSVEIQEQYNETLSTDGEFKKSAKTNGKDNETLGTDEGDGTKQFVLTSDGKDDKNTEFVLASFETSLDVNITFKTYTHTCTYWDTTDKLWHGKGCKVSPASTLYKTICLCNHLTSFASSFYVPVNKIDFAYVFGNADLANNHTVFTTVMCILGVYVLMLIWLRKKDKEDLMKWSAHPLIDNQYGPGYFYTISVHTGFATNAGTRSTVRFDMVGEDGNTGQRLLWDADGYLKLDDGSLNHYVLKLRHAIGPLQSFLIWHDNTGEGSFASWYLDWILVSDLQTGERWAFVCSDWLARNKGEGKIFRSLSPASEEAAAQIQSDFFRILRSTFADDNLWVSLFTRPTPSSFTRVQRLSVCLTFLFLYMITNAMFYRTDDEKEGMQQGKTVNLGVFEINLQEVYIGGISTLIILPVNLLLVILFKSVQMSDEVDTRLAVISKGNMENKYANRRCSAPPIMKYFAWMLVFASIVLSAFFVILYSLLWGKEKSQGWLMSMLTSFLESLILVEPAKAICAAIIILLIFKYSKRANFHEPNTVVYQDELADEGDSKHQLSKAPKAGVDTHQEDWQKKTATASLFRQIVSHVAFVIVTIAIILQHQDIDAFYMTQEVNHMLLGPEGEFTEIQNAGNFWDWTSDVLLPTVYPSNDSLPMVEDDRMLIDGVMFLTGPIRFRQIRIQPDAQCQILTRSAKWDIPCRPSYSYREEDKDRYGTEWKEWTNTTCSDQDTQYCPWSYYSPSKLSGSTYHGRRGTLYAGGGYIEEWDFNPQIALNESQHLKDSSWLDQYTMAVFVEFTLYNANINLFSYVTYLVEFMPTGNADPYPWVHTFRLYDYTSDEDVQAIKVTLTYLLFVLSLLYFIIREIDDIKRSGKKYLLSVGNWLEMSIIISSVMVLLAYLVRKVFAQSASKALQRAHETGGYVNFQPMSNMDQAYSIILGTAGFLSTLKVNILLSFDKRFTQLKRTMVYAGKDLMAFGIYFFIIMCAFVSVNTLVLGPLVEDYSGFIKSLQTLLVLLLGQFRVRTFNTSMQFFSLTFFVLYCVVIGFILCRIFVAIVCDAFTVTRKEDQGNSGVALEKVIGTELKRQFRELFPCKANRDDTYKVQPKDQFGSVTSLHNIPQPVAAWGDPSKSIVWSTGFDAIPSRTPPPSYYDHVDSIWYPDKDFLDSNKRSPDPEGVGLLLKRAEEALARISTSIDMM